MSDTKKAKKTLPLGGTVRYFEAPITFEDPPMSPAEHAADGGGGEPKPRVYKISASNETILERESFGFKWREIYDHSPDSVQLDRFQSGRAPLLLQHDDNQYLGKITKAYLESRALQTEVDWSPSELAQGIKAEVDADHRQSSSMGVLPKRARLEEEDTEKGDLFRITLWQPVELSLVSVPRNPTVGVGLSLNNDGGAPPIEMEEDAMIRFGARMDKAGEGGAGAAATTHAAEPATPAKPAATVEVGSARNERKEVAEIYKIARKEGVEDKTVDGWITRGLSPAECALELYNSRADDEPEAQPGSERIVDLTKREQRKYSYKKAILMQLPRSEGGIPMDGLEAEVHAAIEKQLPENYVRKNGMFVPMRLGDYMTHEHATDRRAAELERQRHALDSKTAGAGGETVFDSAGELIDLLRNKARLVERGAQVLTGVVGPVGFPKLLTGVQVYWRPENASTDVSNSDVTWGMVMLRAKTMMGASAFTRELLAQSSLGIEGIVRRELSSGHVLALDLAGVHGIGANGEPTGIYHADGVQTESMGGVPTYAKLVEMAGKVADANADEGALGYLTTPLMAAKLKTILEFPDAPGGSPVWKGNFRTGEVAGFGASATKQVSKKLTNSEIGSGDEHGVIFGDFGQMLIATFAAMEFVVDPFTLKKKGLIEVATHQMADILIRHPEAFCKSLGATIS